MKIAPSLRNLEGTAKLISLLDHLSTLFSSADGLVREAAGEQGGPVGSNFGEILSLQGSPDALPGQVSDPLAAGPDSGKLLQGGGKILPQLSLPDTDPAAAATLETDASAPGVAAATGETNEWLPAGIAPVLTGAASALAYKYHGMAPAQAVAGQVTLHDPLTPAVAASLDPALPPVPADGIRLPPGAPGSSAPASAAAEQSPARPAVPALDTAAATVAAATIAAAPPAAANALNTPAAGTVIGQGKNRERLPLPAAAPLKPELAPGAAASGQAPAASGIIGPDALAGEAPSTTRLPMTATAPLTAEPVARDQEFVLDNTGVKARDTLPESSAIPRAVDSPRVPSPQIPLTQALPTEVQLPAGEAEGRMASTTTSTNTIYTPLGSGNWSAEVAGRVSIMVKNALSEATLQLSPPELGRMEIKISTEGEQTRILFNVAAAETRDTIDQALPRLREMLEQSGLQLADFDVADNLLPQQQAHDFDDFADSGAGETLENVGEELSADLAIGGSDTLVDYYV